MQNWKFHIETEHSGKMEGDATTGLHKLAGADHQPLLSFVIVFRCPVHLNQRFGSCKYLSSLPLLYRTDPLNSFCGSRNVENKH